MAGGGTITLRTEIDAGGPVIVEVCDTGDGIPAENLKKVFDPFFTTKEVGSGTGLGLAVTYGIIQEHAGTIEAHSEPGSGATFRMEFPVARTNGRRKAARS
jgi:signal transduction histidine kinase